MALLTQDEIYTAFRDMPAFQRVSDQALRRLSELVEIQLAVRGEVLYKLGQVAQKFFVVESGEIVFEEIDRWGGTKHTRHRHKGDVFGIDALVRGEPHHETAIAAEDSMLYTLNNEGWKTLLGEFPTIRRELGATLRFKKQRRLSDLRLGDEEQVLIYTRPHWTILLGRMVVPLLLLGAGVVVSALLGLVINNAFAYLAIAFSILVFLMIVVAYTFADYWTDVYVVTTSRVARTLRQPYVQETLREARIGKIQNISVEFPNFFARVLGWSNVIITTAGGSPIRFDQVGSGPFIRAVISSLVEQVRVRGAQESRAARRARAEQRLLGEGGQTASPTVQVVPVEHKDFLDQLWSVLFDVFMYFVPRTRVERNGQIIYRKHWIELVKSSGAVLLLFLATLVGLVLLLWMVIFQDGQVMGPLTIIVGVIAFGLLLWLFWLYEDWRNDQYILTETAVVDIDRLPLYFREHEKRAGYDAIQDVSYSIPNPVAEILDYGNIVIETAGALGKLTWDHIPHPRRVRSEIFEKMTTFQAKRAEAQRKEREDELEDWLMVLAERMRQDGTGGQ